MHLPLEHVQQQHLQSLIDAEAAERLWTDYKQHSGTSFPIQSRQYLIATSFTAPNRFWKTCSVEIMIVQ
jgi:hypothetical protein